jgi:phenylpropionate dioxygenase-like ring-hydroxylating dioxygenase large terminal subunit
MSIEPAAYTHQDIFDAELDRLFAARMYVCSTHELVDVDSYLALHLGDVAVTLRRTPEGLRAFDNVCLHRCALIDPEGGGKRPFRCRYHAWSYAPDGELRATPLVAGDDLAKRRLHSYPLSVAGEHVFLGLVGKTPAVDKVAHALAETGIPLENPPPFHRGELLQHCNWKLLVENNVESYHLSFVHAQSFIPAGFVSKSDYAWECDAYTCWSRCVPTEATSKSALLQRISRQANHEFRHAFIFPNLFLTATNHMVGFRSYMIPLAPDRTLFKWELFELPALLALAAPVREQIREESIRFTETSLLEDKPMVEACQLGLASRNAVPQLQVPDARIQRFHDYYTRQMSHAAG